MKVSLLTNGPGELWGWVRPVANELRKRGHSVSLWLLPCQFASGYERTAASLLGVDKLEGPASSAWTWGALGKEKTDCVLQLGGDLLFGQRLAKSSSAPLFCYSYGYKRGMEHSHVFTAYESMTLKMPKPRIIGDLVKDALNMDSGSFAWDEQRSPEEGPRLLLFPGSRPAIQEKSIPWLTSIVRILRSALPQLQIATLFSPYMPESGFTFWRDAGLNPVKGAAGVAMRRADYALTQPGTNTLEMMHCGLPALVAAPYDFLSVIPLSGLYGFAASIPFLGSYLKQRGIKRLLERHKGFMALPNRVAGRGVMDELKGDLTPDDLASHIIQSLQNKEQLTSTQKELLSISGPTGATEQLCNALETTIH